MVSRPPTMQEAVVQELRSQIISGELSAGSRINQDAIAAAFDISRMPVREALRQLHSEGFVIIVPHRGAIVSALSPDEIEEIYEIRGALEGLASRLALPALSPEDMAELRTIWGAMGRDEAIDKWVALNERFHAAIMLPSRRTGLLDLIQRYRHRCEPYIRMYVHHLGNSERATQEHFAILAAIEAHDADEVERTVRAHLLSTGSGVAMYVAGWKAGDSVPDIAT